MYMYLDKCDNEAAEKLKPKQRIRNRASTKSNSDFCCLLDPEHRFSTKFKCFWDDFWECIWTKFLMLICSKWFPWFGFCRGAGWPRPQQKWGWVFGLCSRPESFLFKRYVFGVVEAALVFSSKVSAKSEAPTPLGHFWSILFFTHYTWHSALYTLHFTFCISRFALDTPLPTLHTPHSALYSLYVACWTGQEIKTPPPPLTTMLHVELTKKNQNPTTPADQYIACWT